MRTSAPTVVLLVACLIALSNSATAENWPGWRGPRGDGTSREQNIPIRWNAPAGENIAWKADVPGEGYASPIIWNDRIFLVSCLTQSADEAKDRVLQCLDVGTGRLMWQQTVLTAPLETKHSQNSYASSTPATDGETVFVTFLEVDGSTIPAPNVGSARDVTPGRMVVAAYDFAGRRKWLARPGGFVS
ncbi:MAG: PQQ-like beta-propeller repeat protein, partial [Planctomycetes bacterium]|nr:PQQ-like beta-propeller repeat protein [Planctomycetota bacterium]